MQGIAVTYKTSHKGTAGLQTRSDLCKAEQAVQRPPSAAMHVEFSSSCKCLT